MKSTFLNFENPRDRFFRLCIGFVYDLTQFKSLRMPESPKNNNYRFEIRNQLQFLHGPRECRLQYIFA